ncbi:MAG: FKBP-type peptidyl-prolyl cis-trans isomerase [Candidatus Thorarchaeota archaeon]
MSSKDSAEKAKKKTTEKKPKTTAEKKTPAKKAPAKKAKAGSDGETKTTAAKKAKAENVVGEQSLVYIDYTGKTKDDGKVFDTTLEEVAKANDLPTDKGTFEPMLVAIGWNWLLAALEEEMIGLKVGDSKTIEVPPEKGAGPRDPNLIKKIPLAKLQKQGARGYKGEEITFGRERGVITASLGRTVRVDFNNPLAGKTLVFDIAIKEIISDPIEKLLAVVRRRIPAMPKDEYSVSISGKTITIDLPKESRYIENIQYAEIGIASDALKVVEKASEVKLVTTWQRPEPPKENQT